MKTPYNRWSDRRLPAGTWHDRMTERTTMAAIRHRSIPLSLLGAVLVLGALVVSPDARAAQPEFLDFSAGSGHSVCIKKDGTLWAWGKNNYGQLGDGTTWDRYSPVQTGTSSDWAAVAAGFTHTVALKSDGTLWECGKKFNKNWLPHYELPTPLQVVGTESDWAAVAAGSSHTVALKTDGSLWAWGFNDSGELGDSTTAHKSTPVQVGADKDWKAMATGGFHTVARKTDGTLWAWGSNLYGQLGDGDTVNKCSPVQVGTDGDWRAVAAGSYHTVVLKSDGTLWAWGWNGDGQLGDGTTVNTSSPVQAGTDSDWAAVAAGNNHTVALKNDGTLWAWGSNYYGQLGDGTYVSKPWPVQVGAASDWAAVAAGGTHHTVATKTDGTLWAWGRNYYGQLGVGGIKDIGLPWPEPVLLPGPLADAGPDQVVEATSFDGAVVTLDGCASADPNGDPLWLSWSGPFGTEEGETVTVLLPLGTHTITLTVDDGRGLSAVDTVQVTVRDSTPPVLNMPADMIIKASGDTGAQVYYTVTAYDIADPSVVVVSTPPSGSLFPLGATTVHCTATDASGNQATGEFHVLVTTDPDRAVGAVIGAAGGTLTTPDGSVTMTIPAGALAADIFISSAEIGQGFELTSNQGVNGFSLFGLTIQPDGTTFAIPIQLVFSWPDENDDGVVDGTHIQEASLLITKDNVPVTPRARDFDGFDAVANTITFEVTSLSEFCLVFFDEEGPAITTLEAIPAPVQVGMPVMIAATADDTDLGWSPIAGIVCLVDGEPLQMFAVDGAFDSTLELAALELAAFPEPGLVKIEVYAWDYYDNVDGPLESIFLPVYDPSAGFVTGGGWIWSPAGAFHPGLEGFAPVAGKASFGFVSRYQKGAKVPTGNTEFQFKAGGLSFRSSDYQWLVVAGARAQFKGSGTVNGEAGYGFMLTAIDGDRLGGDQPDRFRIKIWETASGIAIYDNQTGTDDAADLTADGTVLQGGSVVIHTK